MSNRPLLIRATSELAARFWPKVRRAGLNECWEWQGKRSNKGYGVFWFNGRVLRANRVAVALACGSIADAFALHRCNNPSCCNPVHLYIGGPRANILQCVNDGRYVKHGCRGEDSGKAKLTEVDVQEIHRLYAAGETQRVIARKFCISKSQVGAIIRGEQWKHLTAMTNSSLFT